MKKVLIITYYWPPIGGAGVQRWLKFVKYLRDFGWEPVVYTPENPELFSSDPSLGKEIPAGITVLKTKIWEPYTLYRIFTGKKRGEKVNPGFISAGRKPGKLEKTAAWIRGNLFIPDARMFWIKPSVKFLNTWLLKNPVNAIVTTGPPHSMHLIGLELKKTTRIPWLADFRDPWTGIDFYQHLMLSSFADKKHKRLEKEVLQQADKVVTIGWKLASELETISGKKAEVITNGFDEGDFPGTTVPLSSTFSIVHTGAMNRDRNPVTFWSALAEAASENKALGEKLRIRLIGKTDFSVLESIRINGLEHCLELVDYIPHDEAVKKMQSAQLLLLPLNNTPTVAGIVTGKLFEYLAAKRPILLIGPDESDSARILRSASAGVICGFSEKEIMKKELLQFFEHYKKGTLTIPGNDLSRFSRKKLTGMLASVLNEITP